jgi:diguanylate cyclase (GGDEF)-like protein
MVIKTQISASRTRWEQYPQLIAIVDHHLQNTYFNLSWRKQLGIEQADNAAQIWDEIIHREDLPQLKRFFLHQCSNNHVIQCRIIQGDGAYHWHTLSQFPLTDRLHGGQVTFLQASEMPSSIYDQMLIKEAFEVHQHLVNETADAIKILSPDLTIIYINKAARQALHTDANEHYIGKNWLELLPKKIHKRCLNAQKKMKQGEQAGFEIVSQEGLGQSMYWYHYLVPKYHQNGQLLCILVVSRDMTKHYRIKQALNKASRIDALTGLLNRQSFKKKLQSKIKQHQQQQKKLGLLLINLDHFKTVNDCFGYAAGDYLLKSVAKRLMAGLDKAMVLARCGGDEFAVIVPDIAHATALLGIAEQILSMLEDPIYFGQKIVNCGISIGASICPEHSQQAEGLLRCADIALHEVKASGRGSVELLDETMLKHVAGEMRQLNVARMIVQHNRITPYYQPQINLKTGQIIGLEALLRWHDAAGNLRFPADMLSAFENYEWAKKISTVMQHKIFQDIRNWLCEGILQVPISINIAPIEFIHDDCAEVFIARLEGYQIPAKFVQIEITEHHFVQRGEHLVQRALRTLRAYGIKIALDDFGTGYSSLTHLRTFSVDFIKIEGQFLRSMQSDQATMALIQAICQLAPSLNLRVIAEGIESTRQRDLLIDSGCILGQGFLYHQALPAASIRQLLKAAACSVTD